MTLLRSMFLLALVLWVGSVLFFSFVGAPAVFKALPREQAGNVVGAIFPIYYAIGTACGVAALACLLALSRGARMPWLAASILIAMLGVNLYAQGVVQPQVRAVKTELRAAQESGESAAPLRERFSRLHALSMALNLIVLAGGVFLVLWTARRLNL